MRGGRNGFSIVSVGLVLGAIVHKDPKVEKIMIVVTRFNGAYQRCAWVMIGLKNGNDIVSTVSGSMNSMEMVKK
jgi:hypothetical protein